MCDKDLLVGYIYDEMDGAERRVLQQHLASCRECRDEAQALRATRAHLASWQLPASADSGVRTFLAPDRNAFRHRVPRGWGLAAAAAAVLTVGAAAASVEVRTVDGGLMIRSGWSRAVPPGGAAAVGPTVSRDELAAVQQRVRELEAALAERPATPVAAERVSYDRAGLTDAELLRRVRELIGESETRQGQALAARLMQGMREMQAAHTSDLLRLERASNQLQGAFNDEVLRARDMEKQFYRFVSSTQLQR